MSTIQLYWSPKTRASRIVWLLEEMEKPYDLVEVPIRDPEAERQPEFLAASPLGKVPAVVDGEVAVADSAAIATYLADRYPECGLAPATDHPLRGSYLYWMLFTPGVIEPAMAEKFAGLDPNPMAYSWGSYDLMIQTFENAVREREWILGDRFSAADVLLGSSAGFLRQFGLVSKGPIADYGARCAARPAHVKAMQLDDV